MKRALDEIFDEARAAVAAGREPDARDLRARITAAGGSEDALQQLERVLSIQRARARLERPPERPVAPVRTAAPLRAALRARPTVNANMEVRRDGPASLAWETAPAIVGWELRISERPDARGDYVVRETRELPGDTTRAELPLGDLPLRVHLLGRTRDGRLLRRAVISGLSRETWAERWQRRASAS